jgi:3-phosphoshikimate 1-carboxyvinyltransferase
MDVVRVRAGDPPERELLWHPPGDKSISQRATMLAAMSDGETRISGLPVSDDLSHNIAALARLGVECHRSDGTLVVRGRGLRGLQEPGGPVDAGNSATTARLLIAALSGQRGGRFVVRGNASLSRRPMGWLVSPLQSMGAVIEWVATPGVLPVAIDARPLRGGLVEVVVHSAQGVSPLLVAGLLGRQPTTVVRRTRARDHTERLLAHLGIRLEVDRRSVTIHPPRSLRPRPIEVPGDVSAAAPLVAATVLNPTPGVALHVRDVGLNPTRLGLLWALRRMGAAVAWEVKSERCGEPRGAIVARSGRPLRGIQVAGHEVVQSMIDELPLLAAAGAIAHGTTVIRDCGELRDKDTDRRVTITRMLRAFGAAVELADDQIMVRGGAPLSGTRVPPSRDHRITMAAGVLAATLPDESAIEGAGAVTVSFPGFFDGLGRLAEVSGVSRLATTGVAGG